MEGWKSLPPRLWRKILIGLKTSQVFRVASTCRELHDLVHREVWECLVKRDWPVAAKLGKKYEYRDIYKACHSPLFYEAQHAIQIRNVAQFIRHPMDCILGHNGRLALLGRAKVTGITKKSGDMVFEDLGLPEDLVQIYVSTDLSDDHVFGRTAGGNLWSWGYREGFDVDEGVVQEKLFVPEAVLSADFRIITVNDRFLYIVTNESRGNIEVFAYSRKLIASARKQQGECYSEIFFKGTHRFKRPVKEVHGITMSPGTNAMGVAVLEDGSVFLLPAGQFSLSRRNENPRDTCRYFDIGKTPAKPLAHVRVPPHGRLAVGPHYLLVYSTTDLRAFTIAGEPLAISPADMPMSLPLMQINVCATTAGVHLYVNADDCKAYHAILLADCDKRQRTLGFRKPWREVKVRGETPFILQTYPSKDLLHPGILYIKLSADEGGGKKKKARLTDRYFSEAVVI